MDPYLLFFNHYSEEENMSSELNVKNVDDPRDDFYPGDLDTLKNELNEMILAMKANSPIYSIGYPIFVKNGLEFIQATPGSGEAGFKRIDGVLQKM